jgi:hypothetical protein
VIEILPLETRNRCLILAEGEHGEHGGRCVHHLCLESSGYGEMTGRVLWASVRSSWVSVSSKCGDEGEEDRYTISHARNLPFTRCRDGEGNCLSSPPCYSVSTVPVASCVMGVLLTRRLPLEMRASHGWKGMGTCPVCMALFPISDVSERGRRTWRGRTLTFNRLYTLLFLLSASSVASSTLSLWRCHWCWWRQRTGRC